MLARASHFLTQRSPAAAAHVRHFTARPESALASPLTVSVLGMPFDLGQPLPGVDSGPQALRDEDLRARVTSLGWRFQDMGDVEPHRPSASDPQGETSAKNAFAVMETCRRIADATHAEAAAGRFVLSLGGDHSIALGSIAGVLRARPGLGVVWVDAHADINSPAGSPSGNMHGMPVSFLMRLVQLAGIPGTEWLDGVPKLDPSSIVYVGLRDVDAYERGQINDLGIKAYSMRDVDKYGIGRVMEESMDHLLRGGDRPLHMSYDIDAVDPAIAPETGTRVHGGLSYREAHYVAEELALSGLLGSMDMVEVNPALGAAGRRGVPEAQVLASSAQAAGAAAGIIESALGKNIL